MVVPLSFRLLRESARIYVNSLVPVFVAVTNILLTNITLDASMSSPFIIRLLQEKKLANLPTSFLSLVNFPPRFSTSCEEKNGDGVSSSRCFARMLDFSRREKNEHAILVDRGWPSYRGSSEVDFCVFSIFTVPGSSLTSETRHTLKSRWDVSWNGSNERESILSEGDRPLYI